MTETTLRYSPGTGTLVVREGIAVLSSDPVTAPGTAALWSALASGADVRGLRAVLEDAGTAWFAILDQRGGALVVDSAGTTVLLDGEAVATGMPLAPARDGVLTIGEVVDAATAAPLAGILGAGGVSLTVAAVANPNEPAAPAAAPDTFADLLRGEADVAVAPAPQDADPVDPEPAPAVASGHTQVWSVDEDAVAPLEPEIQGDEQEASAPALIDGLPWMAKSSTAAAPEPPSPVADQMPPWARAGVVPTAGVPVPAIPVPQPTPQPTPEPTPQPTPQPTPSRHLSPQPRR